jgi:Holliday junction resolvase RusA-like endonuclease
MTDLFGGLLDDGRLERAETTAVHLPEAAGRCFVRGVPVPQGSKRGFVVGGRAVVVDANSKTKPWRADIHAHVLAEVGTAVLYPEDIPVALDLLFVMPRRAAEPKRRTSPHVRKPDVDKLARAVLDALAGVVYARDQQVTDMRARKRTARIGEQPGLHLCWRPDR